MEPNPDDLITLLVANPHLVLARATHDNSSYDIQVLEQPQNSPQPLNLPLSMSGLRIKRETHPGFTDLRAHEICQQLSQPNQRCQNEPIQLGTQIQPQGADWVGTAGAPIAWNDGGADTKYGWLSNWHVMAMGDERAGRLQYQPTKDFPAMGQLAAYTPVTADGVHHVDGAIADSLVVGYHTTSNEILTIGQLNPPTGPLTIGDVVRKVGRTTGSTDGICTATGAAVRVSYGDFSAVFADQDVIEDTHDPFAAPGDSGSLICKPCDCPGQQASYEPAALLFAGGGGLTVGNPIRYVEEAFGLQWNF